jgi:polar amino acid transport system substrate-binding protein/arginine/ornithine transport system substrate-binding protein
MRRLLGAGILAAAALHGLPAAADLGICVEGAYPPFSETHADGSITGFDIDIAGALCAEIGETCHLVKTSWERMIPSLVGNKCDAIVASMSDTAERRKEIDFTHTYYKAPVRFVGPAGAALTDTADGLKGRTVGVQRGTVNQIFMTAHYPATPLKLYGNQEHVLMDLTLGRLDAVLGEAPQLEVGFLRTPAGQGFAFFGSDHFDPAIQGGGAAIGVRKADIELRDRLSAAIAAIRDDGTYDEIAGRYFDFDISGE